MKDWWDRRSRLEYELNKLKDAGLRPDAAPEIPERGPFRVRVLVEIEGRDHELIIIFPDLYPYFRFEVEAPTLELPYHQNPLGKNLCLLDRGAVFSARSDTAAQFLLNRLPTLINAAQTEDSEAAAELEEPRAEPVTAYFPAAPGSIVLIDGQWKLPDGVTQGNVLLGTDQPRPPYSRLAVLELTDVLGNRLAELDPRLARLFPQHLHGDWMHTPELVFEEDAAQFLHQLRQKVGSYPVSPNRVGGIEQTFSLITTPEEIDPRNPSGLGWIAVTSFHETKKGAKKRGPTTRRSGGEPEHHFLRVARAGPDDLRARVPELRSLQTKTVAIIGLGSLGAPAALALAQAGIGTLRLVDDDWIDPGTSVRWPRGLAVAGAIKVQALKRILELEHPYTRVDQAEEGVHRIGYPWNERDLDKLHSLLAGTDLVLDTTGEHNVQYFLSEITRDLSIPFVTVSGTLGGWGGRIFRINPENSGGCWYCYENLEREGKIPAPSAGPTKEHEVQPQGCGDRTFTGAGFDMHTLALAAVRGAVEFLSPEYPRTEWGALVISFRGPSGEPIPPTFRGVQVSKHPKCLRCAKEPSSSG